MSAADGAVGPRRRGGVPNRQQALGLSYGEVGATETDRVLAFPPAGFRPAQFSKRIGSGEERFRSAAASLMTWGVQRGAGIEVRDVEPDPDHANAWRGLGGAASRARAASADPSAFITPGTNAVFILRGGPFTVPGPIKVISIVDEERRVGFSYGTRPGHPADGEALMLLEHDEDDNGVWLTIRSITKASGPRWVVPLFFFRLRQKKYTQRFLIALHPAGAR